MTTEVKHVTLKLRAKIDDDITCELCGDTFELPKKITAYEIHSLNHTLLMILNEMRRLVSKP